jgi:NTF2 fold immunity protein
MSMKARLFGVLLLLVLTLSAQHLPVTIVRVPDAATALIIAEPALKKTYGKRQIEYEKPLTAILEDGIWTVYGTLCCPDRKGRRTCEVGKCVGGVATLKLRQSDGKILSVIHTK